MYSVRQLKKEDWQLYKDLRIRAVTSDPNVFAYTLEYEVAQSDDHWQKALTDSNIGVFVLFDDDTSVGMTGIAMLPRDKAEDTAHLWGSWIDKGWRGKGLSDYLYKARIEWAKNHPTCRTIIVSHRKSNTASKRANQRHGFIWTHEEERVWPDGKTESEVCYKLDLNKPHKPQPPAKPALTNNR